MDSFFGIGVFELVFIVIFALIFLGPERLPQVLRELIGFMRKVRSLSSEITQQINEEFGDLAELDPRRQIQQTLNEGLGEPKKQTKTSASSSTSAAKPKTTTTQKAVPNQKKSTAASTAKPAKETKAEETKAEETKAKAATDDGKVVARGDLPATAAEDKPAAPVAATTEAAAADSQDGAGEPVSADAEETAAVAESEPVAEEPVAEEETLPVAERAEAQPAARSRQTQGEEQISPASVYFAQQKKQAAEAENGADAAPDTNHAVPRAEARDDVATADAAVDEAFDDHSIAPPDLAQRQPQTAEEEPAEPIVQPSGTRAAREENA